jgi:hypothetical protein
MSPVNAGDFFCEREMWTFYFAVFGEICGNVLWCIKNVDFLIKISLTFAYK